MLDNKINKKRMKLLKNLLFGQFFFKIRNSPKHELNYCL